MKFPPGLPLGKPKLARILTKNLSFARLKRSSSKQHDTRLHNRSKSKKTRSEIVDITTLQTSLSFREGVRELRQHNFQPSDLQYLILAVLTLFSLWIAPSAPFTKTFSILAGLWLLFVPATRQFFKPSLPIWVWLLYFFCSRFIPYAYRPHIWVRVLPALENVIYGANLSNILSAYQFVVLDILAWLPYGIIHFAAPAGCSLCMFIFAAPKTTPVFARTFGWMSILGVTIQLFFPCTPPWYENENGLVPAAYDMPGSPAGLARIDKIFGFDMYTTNFTQSPLPFGAFPSLHAANAVLEALFMSHCFPRFRVFFAMYTGWVWWATMYLSHHYAIDLVGGGVIAVAFFYAAKSRWLPRRQPESSTRWDYEFVELGNKQVTTDEESDPYFSFGHGNFDGGDSSDNWTLGSASSRTSSSGALSPTFLRTDDA